jgi:hypothetical protein
MKIRKIIKRAAAVLVVAAVFFSMSGVSAFADSSIAHNPNRNVQTQGVGNPFNYGERNTPENASVSEKKAINHAMTVQQVKYALYKEIDEHWDLISVRLGQPNREMVYALFLGIGTRESTIGGNGNGADLETCQSEGFGVNPGHAYGTLQTAVTAYADCNPSFMKEDNVPEMYQYSFNESNFYDAIISNHMGIRKILHFVELAINEEGLSGYQVVRGALKGFNTGWATYTGDEAYYKDYPDEIISLARWYYEEGHLYDNVFTWTGASDVDKYRQGNVWSWWGSGTPSMAAVSSSEVEEPVIVVPDVDANATLKLGDVDNSGKVDAVDASLVLLDYALTQTGNASCFKANQKKAADVNKDSGINAIDASLILGYYAYTATGGSGSLEKYLG